MCCVASVADARNPLFRGRSAITRTQTNRPTTPPKSSAMQAVVPAAATLQSDEQMTKIYGPSILDRS